VEVKILKEAGYVEALIGVALSYNTSDFGRTEETARKLANKDGGHNKFLESIVVWLDINAARYWWQQFDTHRIGVTKQSESTMHTITKQELSEDSFEHYSKYDCVPRNVIDWLNNLILEKEFFSVKVNLPESFLQRRIVCTNYKTLRNIILQRCTHKLPEWRQFITAIMIGDEGVEHPSLLPNPWKKEGK